MVEINVPQTHTGMRKRGSGEAEKSMRSVWTKYRGYYEEWVANGCIQAQFNERVKLGSLDYQQFKQVVVQSLKTKTNSIQL